MAENIVIYAGINKVGKLKKKAIEREAKRNNNDGSVSSLVWELFRKHGSPELKRELEAAEKGAVQ